MTVGRARGEIARAWIAGASFANLAFLSLWTVFFEADTPKAFLVTVSNRDLLAALLNVGLAGLATAGAVAASSAVKARWARIGAEVLVISSAVVPLNAARMGIGFPMERFVHRIWSPGLGPALAGVVVFISVFVVARWHRRLASGIRQTYLVFSPFLLVTAVRAALLFSGHNLTREFGSAPPAARTPSADTTSRVILIVFDELDYRVAFGERPDGVALPAFDSLRAQGLFGLDAHPPAGNTSESMLSYLLGIPVVRTTGSGARTAMLQLGGGRGERQLDSLGPDLFRGVRDAGGNAALVGWTLPYCRTFVAANLVDCRAWPAGNHLGIQEGLAATMFHQWLTSLPAGGRLIHLVRYRQMLAAGLVAVADPELDLVVLHLPVPHDPWIFSARRQRFSLTAVGPRGYLGNLALADRTLDQLRAALRDAGLEARTGLIVTGDHYWRRSAELDGRRDPRVPFLLWQQGGGQVECRTGFNTMVAGDLILRLLAGPMSNTAVCDWLGTTADPAGP